MPFSPVPAEPPADEAPVYVPPGRTLASGDGSSLTTIVSTGAAVCVWDPLTNVGGMSHFLLPEAGNAPEAPRFGDVAMRTLLAEVARLGGVPGRLRASVYGGSTPPIVTGAGHLGDRNVEAAMGFLRMRGVPVLQRDVGGSGARKIVFSPRAGRAEVARIGAAA